MSAFGQSDALQTQWSVEQHVEKQYYKPAEYWPGKEASILINKVDQQSKLFCRDGHKFP
jgi:hypothetical protein